MRIGVISNTHSGRNRKALTEIRKLLSGEPSLLHREARFPEQVAEALEEFSRAGVDVVAVNGGDGTVQAVVTHLFRQPLFNPMPLLALLPGGTTNMTAYDISGGRRRLLPSFRALLQTARAGADWEIVERPVLRVQGGAAAGSHYGFFFGTAAIVKGMDYFQDKVHSKGLKNELGPGLTLLRFLYGILRNDPAYTGGQSIAVGLNGDPPDPTGETLLLFVTTLERFFLGLRPFWGREPQPLHLTRIRARPRHLLRVLPSIVRGRPNRLATEAAGYYSHNGSSVRLAMDGSFSLDGELQQADRERGSVELSCAGRLRFIRL